MTDKTVTGRLPRSRSARRAAGFVAGCVSAALVLSGCSIYDAPLPGGASTGDNPMTIQVMFRDVLDLVPQSTVKIDDVTVGKVKKVELKGYIAKVTVEVPGDVNLPDNARAEIRQTSLLGEKFVQLSEPTEPSRGKLSDKDVIGLDRTGRNPEVEEVLGALSLLLNGGGVGQLKTIVSELNNAFEGRESEVRSVLTQIRSFMGQLDQNKESIVLALENTNRLAAQLKRQDATIKSALDNVPATLRSVNRQRDDLVKLLAALNRLSGVGVRVIQASKESTINSLRSLAPVLDGFAKAGENFPKSFQVFLTYPFVDEAVGRDPQVARNLHMGDYTNLDVNLDLSLDLLDGLLPDLPTPACDITKIVTEEVKRQLGPLNILPGSEQFQDILTKALVGVTCSTNTNDIAESVTGAIAAILGALAGPAITAICAGVPAGNPLCAALKSPAGLPKAGLPLEDLGLGGVTGGLGGATGGLIRPRVAPGAVSESGPVDPFGLKRYGLDPGVGTMLFQGVAEVR
jgi:phospholipid/cholesterol/gamma-HCH transport system substrate-binding protein